MCAARGTCLCERRRGYDRRGLGRGRTVLVALTLAACVLACANAGGRASALSLPPLPPLPSLPVPSGPTPIPSVAVPAPAAYSGAPATPHPVRGTGTVPHNPFMAPNGESEIHDDGWQTDAYSWSGPLGALAADAVFIPGAGAGLRVDRVRQPWSRGVDLHQHDGAGAVHARPDHAGDAGDVLAPAAHARGRPTQPEHLPGLLERRLLLPRQPRPGRDRHHDAAHLRDRRDRRRARVQARARLRPVVGAHLGRGDHLRAAGFNGPVVVRRAARRRGRDTRPRDRSGPT